MWGIGNTLFNGALEAAAGMAVSSAVTFLIERRKKDSKRQLEAGPETAARILEMREGLDVTLYSLQQELMKIRCAISAARGRRITDQDLLEWFAQIINASYLGNYYHRAFKYRNALPLMIESEGTNDLAIFPSYRTAKRQHTNKTLLFGDVENMKLHDVLKMLKSIDIHAFLLMVNAQPERPMKTFMYMEHNRLLNRDKERQHVMNFLFEPSKASENNVTVLPIVGPPGGGKTSLALHCFYDPKVENHFSLKIKLDRSFIYLTDHSYGFCLVLKEILRQCNSTYITCDDGNTLLVMLKQNLCGERFLLVVDSAWILDCMVLKVLWDCLSCGKQGSKVIFISDTYDYERYYKMIVKPEAVMSIMVDSFSEEEYLLYFNEHAFGGADPEDYPELAKMGREIAKKINGSVWGAKILGELLRDNLNATFWSNFLHGGFLSPLERGNDFWLVVKTMCLLLPKNLQLHGIAFQVEEGHEDKTFRELMILGPNHCSPLIKEEGNYGVKFTVSIPVFLNKCMSFRVTCVPIGDQSKIIFL